MTRLALIEFLGWSYIFGNLLGVVAKAYSLLLSKEYLMTLPYHSITENMSN